MPSKITHDGLGIFIFSLLLYSGMWVSKTIHPLWFDHNHALGNFGISYAVMAAAGASSFLLGRAIAKVPLRLAMFVGCLLYTVGMGMRIFPSLPVSVASGFIAGIGASTALICLSSWPFEQKDECDRNRFFGYSLLSSNFARGVVVTATGAFLLLPGYSENYYQMILLLSAALPLIAFVLLYPTIPTFKAPRRGSKTAQSEGSIVSNDTLPLLVIYSLVSGLTVSFVLPYLPILLNKQGLTDGMTVMILGLCSLVAFLTQPIVMRGAKKTNMRMAFAASIFCLAVSTISLSWDGWGFVFVFWMGLRFVAANSVTYTQRVLEMRLIQKGKAQSGMGALQSAFLFGDMMGGGVSGFLWATGKGTLILPVLAATILANGLFFFWITGRTPRSQKEVTLG